MKKLFVRFAADNDFINTVTPFVKALAERVFFGGWDDITKEKIVSVFNAHAFSFYRMYQSCWSTDEDEFVMKDYLKIAIKDVMFDEEIEEFAKSGQWNGDGCVAYLNHENKIETYIL